MLNLMLLFVLVLSACVKPPDVPVCRELAESRITAKDQFGIINISLKANPVCLKEIGEFSCGYCTWTISAKSQYVGEAEKTYLYGHPWSQIRLSAILVPSESYAKVKEYIINNCKKQHDCQDDIDRWRIKFGEFETK